MENKESVGLVIPDNPKSEKQIFIEKLDKLLTEYDYPINLNFPVGASEDDRVLWRIRDFGIREMLMKAKEKPLIEELKVLMERINTLKASEATLSYKMLEEIYNALNK